MIAITKDRIPEELQFLIEEAIEGFKGLQATEENKRKIALICNHIAKEWEAKNNYPKNIVFEAYGDSYVTVIPYELNESLL